jgi:hypothetical protein
MITPKKRFEVLKRDWFRCTYCGRNGKDVTLEVDHIIAKKWSKWDDSMENLTTCCRECNQWKWTDIIEKPAKNLYKHKIEETVKEVKDYFYSEWNKAYLWSVDKKTAALLNMYINHHIKDDNIYQTYLNYPPLYWERSPYWNDWKNVDEKKMNIIFMQWWSFCDNVLDIMKEEFIEQYIDWLIEEVVNDDVWLPKNNKHEWRFCNRLNYKLTEYLDEIYWDKNYVIYRFTLHPNLITNG